LTRFVLDTSVTLAWCFEDESSIIADQILDLLEAGEAVTPAIWPLEVANALLIGERRERITASGISRFLRLLRSLNIHVDDQTASVEMEGLVELARSRQLPAYDAAYLELAMREGIPLATLDGPLERAAKEVKLPRLFES
jgi:predicted nucleic acid-binding protein